MDCAKCYAYVYDTIARPFKNDYINHARAMGHGHHVFAAELVRIANGEEDSMQFLATLFVEAGGINRSCFQRNTIPLANTWIYYQLRQIGSIRDIHSEHSPAPLRIRIPGKIYPDITPPIRRIQRSDVLYA